MFLDNLLRQNRPLVEATVNLHQNGDISPNTYVLDLDTIVENAVVFTSEARRLGLKTYAMTKQIGRNPPALQAMVDGGVDGFVAVDMDGARPIRAAGHQIGHIGHLVQIPQHEADEAARLSAAYWTVFSHDKASEAARAASAVGTEQPLLARIHAPGDQFYMGHEGGFPAGDITTVATQLDSLGGARFAGITTFPALLFDQEAGKVLGTANLTTLERALAALSVAGFSNLEVNAPGTTSTAVLNLLADAGATQVEPGHGLTGTTPLHAVAELPERTAMLYVSEISHTHGGEAFCFGGGLYVDPVFSDYQVTALVGKDAEQALSCRVPVRIPPPSAIDYYGMVQAHRAVATGETVIFGFRAQAFVTRANVAPVSGISRGSPRVEGLWRVTGAPSGGRSTAAKVGNE